MLLSTSTFNFSKVARFNSLNPLIIGLFVAFLSFSFASFSSVKSEAKAQAQQELLQTKVDFILKVAKNITLDSGSDSKEFVIAVYGNNSDAKSLYKSLKAKVAGRSVDGKPIEVQLFKRMSAVKSADLIYVNGESKVSLSELENKVGRKYILLTEDFPY